MSEKKELFSINVYLDDYQSVENGKDKVCMILFHGDCECDFFKGEILPGGADTQKFFRNEQPLLSARYILKGTDKSGNPTKIFIENNGTWNSQGNIETKPRIITDSEELTWLETAKLTGAVCDGNKEGHIIIKYYAEDDIIDFVK